MADKTISIGFKFEEGANGLRQMVVSASDLRNAMRSAVVEAQGLNTRWINIASACKGLESLKTSLSGLSGALSACSGDARGFSDSMRAVNTMASQDAAGLEALKSQVTALASEVPVARDALANGLYQVISNGVPEDNWISFLEASARSSVGGMADLNEVVGVTSTIIKNYGMSWEEAAAIQDKIQLTARNGVTDFGQLAAALPKVTANAATLGVGIDELMATFATLTGVSGNTSEVSTQLAAVLNSLVKPSSEAAKTAEAMGIQFDAAAIKAAGGLQQFLASLDTAVSQYARSSGQLEQEVYGRLFGSAEAMRALIPLNGELADKFAQNIDTMQASAGTMDAAFEDMSQTGEASAQKLKNSFAGITDAFYKITAPAKPLVDFSLAALGTAANVGILVTSMGALKGAVTGSWLVRGLSSLHNSLNSVTLASVRYAAAADKAAVASKACGVAMAGIGLGLALPVIYGIIKGLREASAAADTLRKSEQDLADVRAEGVRRMTDQKAAIETLLHVAEDEKASLDARKKAVDDLNNIIPNYNASIDETTGKYKATKKALDDYIGSLTRLYEIEAAKEKIKDNAKKKFELQEEIEDLKKQKVVASPALSPTPTPQTTMGGGVPLGIGALMGNSATNSAIDLEIDRRHKKIEELDKSQERLMGKYASGIVANEPANSGFSSTSDTSNNASGSSNNTPTLTPPPEGSLAELGERIKAKKVEFELAVDQESRVRLMEELDALEEEQRTIKALVRFEVEKPDAAAFSEVPPLKLTVDDTDLQAQLDKTSAGLEEWQDKAGETPRVGDMVGETFSKLSSSMRSVGSLLGEQAGGWANFGATLVSSIGEMLPALASLVGGQFAAAMASGTASGAAIGFPQNIPAIASIIAAITAVMASVPKFADGGIAYGPTLGLFGEYAGASHNPEVVAPLDKLRGLIAGSVQGAGGGGEVVFRIEGQTLVGVLANATRISSRAGRRTGIKI